MHQPRFKISLRFFGRFADADHLSHTLKMTPVHVHVMGQRRKTPKGRELEGFYDESYCTFSIEQRDEEQLHEALERAADDLMIHADVFDGVRNDGGRIEFFVGWFSEGNTGNTLPFPLFIKLGRMKIDLSLDVYGSDREMSSKD
jgi:hypothetical protein